MSALKSTNDIIHDVELYAQSRIRDNSKMLSSDSINIRNAIREAIADIHTKCANETVKLWEAQEDYRVLKNEYQEEKERLKKLQDPLLET